jgi:hypothetical protein
VVVTGQPGTRTVPPVTSAAARNGAALDRSGSTTCVPPAIGPGATRQVLVPTPSASTPDARSTSSVISMWGWDGTGPSPVWMISMPLS